MILLTQKYNHDVPAIIQISIHGRMITLSFREGEKVRFLYKRILKIVILKNSITCCLIQHIYAIMR